MCTPEQLHIIIAHPSQQSLCCKASHIDILLTIDVAVCFGSLCFSLQCSVPLHSGHRIINRPSSNKEGSPPHVLNKTIANSNSGSLQGVRSGHHTHWQQTPAILSQALPCGHNFILWTGPRWSSLESEEWWNRNAYQFKVSGWSSARSHDYSTSVMVQRIISYCTTCSVQLCSWKPRRRLYFFMKTEGMTGQSRIPVSSERGH